MNRLYSACSFLTPMVIDPDLVYPDLVYPDLVYPDLVCPSRASGGKRHRTSNHVR